MGGENQAGSPESGQTMAPAAGSGVTAQRRVVPGEAEGGVYSYGALSAQAHQRAFRSTQPEKRRGVVLATTGHTHHGTTPMLYSRGSGGCGSGVEEAFHSLLFLYVQDLAPFRMVRWLPALRRACLSTPLYKNNPLVKN
jgi:hypothetical protein